MLESASQSRAQSVGPATTTVNAPGAPAPRPPPGTLGPARTRRHRGDAGKRRPLAGAPAAGVGRRRPHHHCTWSCAGWRGPVMSRDAGQRRPPPVRGPERGRAPAAGDDRTVISSSHLAHQKHGRAPGAWTRPGGGAKRAGTPVARRSGCSASAPCAGVWRIRPGRGGGPAARRSQAGRRRNSAGVKAVPARAEGRRRHDSGPLQAPGIWGPCRRGLRGRRAAAGGHKGLRGRRGPGSSDSSPRPSRQNSSH